LSRPIVNLSLGLIAGNTVTLLDFSDELFGLSLYAIEVVIGQLSPLLPNASP